MPLFNTPDSDPQLVRIESILTSWKSESGVLNKGAITQYAEQWVVMTCVESRTCRSKM